VNHLAHIFLAGEEPESLLGNLAGDFVKGPLKGEFRPGVEAGIRMHRSIDAFTDSHPAAGEFRRHIARQWGHYARVIADIFFDHFLAAGWSRYSDASFDEHLQSLFRKIDGVIDAMPPGLQRVYPRMRDGRWFRSYATLDGIRWALHHTAGRMSRHPPLADAVSCLIEDRAVLQRHFDEFFPEVVRYAERLRDG
jgi:acyl carrier protein phosphodiesterase